MIKCTWILLIVLLVGCQPVETTTVTTTVTTTATVVDHGCPKIGANDNVIINGTTFIGKVAYVWTDVNNCATRYIVAYVDAHGEPQQGQYTPDQLTMTKIAESLR